MPVGELYTVTYWGIAYCSNMLQPCRL